MEWRRQNRFSLVRFPHMDGDYLETCVARCSTGGLARSSLLAQLVKVALWVSADSPLYRYRLKLVALPKSASSPELAAAALLLQGVVASDEDSLHLLLRLFSFPPCEIQRRYTTYSLDYMLNLHNSLHPLCMDHLDDYS